MGAGQSTDGSTGAAVDVQVKTSYYELLGIDRQATEEQIKKAYRRKALELHPDRNYGNEEEATRTFAEIQAAHEVLSDPQERAWYDSHEAAILRGDDGAGADAAHSYDSVQVTSADDLARIVRRFNSNVEFNDGPSGFFGFLNEQFEHLAKEEKVAAVWENVDTRDYPPFGHKGDTHDDVVKEFYSAWTNFSTVKSFAWKDKYRLSEAPDRRIRRLMEKENNNLRQESIREFNEAVRSFVLFVRKRDPRYQPSTQSEAERQQMLQDAAAAQRARARAANQAKAEGEVPAWAQARNESDLEESEAEAIEQELIECVACNKTFKSEKQFEAHERSKKHQKAIQALQKKMRKENKNLHLDSMQASKSSMDDWDVIGEDDDLPDMQSDEVLELEADELGDLAEGVHDASLDDLANDIQPSPLVDEQDSAPVAVKDGAAHERPVSTPDEDSDTSSDEQPHDNDAALSARASGDEDSDRPDVKKLGKAAQKRAKKAAAASGAEPTENTHKCAGCSAAFPSRTQLFQHIKKHGHAALKSATKAKKRK